MPTIEQRVEAVDRWIAEALTNVHRAVRNLHELSPGFSSTTPGNGSPGGGKGGGQTIVLIEDWERNGDRVRTTSVEAGVLTERWITADAAVVALERFDELARRMQADAKALAELGRVWGYATAGEYTGDPARRAKPTESQENAERYCARHDKFGIAEPRGDTKTGARGDLCWWCARFERDHGYLPPGRLLHLRAEGYTITKALIDSVRKDELLDVEREKKRGGVTKSARRANQQSARSKRLEQTRSKP